MAHHAPDHRPAHSGKTVIFSLLLFFALTAAGHYVFVVMAEAPTSRAAEIIGSHH